MTDMPPYKVYGLIDPRNERVFYIGMSYIVLSRVGSHDTDKKGSAYLMCQEIIRAGYKPRHCIFGIFEDGGLAAHLEATLITALPDLVNKTHRHERGEFWRGAEETRDAIMELDAIGVMAEAQCG